MVQPGYLLDSLNGVEILQQLLHDNRLQLLKALHCLTHKHQHIKCCLLVTVTQEFHQLHGKETCFKTVYLMFCFRTMQRTVAYNKMNLPVEQWTQQHQET